MRWGGAQGVRGEGGGESWMGREGEGEKVLEFVGDLYYAQRT